MAAKEKDILAYYDHAYGFLEKTNAFVRVGSATSLAELPDSCVDYVFTDPPFGSNIYYSEPNLLWEVWLGRTTDIVEEAVVHRKNDGGTKRLPDYARLMTEAFTELYRVLKPGRWATVEFNNSDGSVFEVIKQSIRNVGFEIANMLLLDDKVGGLLAPTRELNLCQSQYWLLRPAPRCCVVLGSSPGNWNSLKLTYTVGS